MYVIAAYIRRYVDLNKVKHMEKAYVGLSALLMVTMVIFYFLSKKITLFASFNMHNYYFRNNSLIVLASSIALLLSFLKLKLKSSILIKFVKFVSPLTLGVYLIHDNPLIREVLWKQLFPLRAFERDILLLPKVLGVVVAVFVSGVLIDYIRAKLFSIFETAGWYKRLMNMMDGVIPQITKKLDVYDEKTADSDIV